MLNFSDATVTRTLRVTGFTPDGALEVVGEGRSVGAAGRIAFTDTFGPYALHIYRTT